MTLLLLAFLQLVWASSYVAMKGALSDLPLGLILIFRYGFAVLLFLAAGRLHFREKFSGKEWGLIVLIGWINFSGSPYFQLKALTLTYAFDVSVMVAFEPMITALLAVFFLRERLERGTLLVFGTATLGVLIMAGWEGTSGSIERNRLVGDGIFVGSLLCEGLCSTASKHLTAKRDPFVLLAWMILAGFVGNVVGNWGLLRMEILNSVPITGWAIVFYLALFCTVIGYGGWFYLLKRIPLNQIALSLFLQPVLGSALAFLILKEPLNWQTLAGSLLVFSSLLIWLVHRLKLKILRPNYPKPLVEGSR